MLALIPVIGPLIAITTFGAGDLLSPFLAPLVTAVLGNVDPKTFSAIAFSIAF